MIREEARTGGILVDVPYQREAEIVLAMWREVEGQLSRASSGSSEEEYLHAEAARLRDEYSRLIREAEEHHRPVPPPFPVNDGST